MLSLTGFPVPPRLVSQLNGTLPSLTLFLTVLCYFLLPVLWSLHLGSWHAQGTDK